MEIVYEEMILDINDYFRKVTEFLEIPFIQPKTDLVRQNTKKLPEIIQNYDELKRYFANTELAIFLMIDILSKLMTTFIFIHIPKTAGMTIRAIFHRQYRNDEIYRIRWNFDRNNPFDEFLSLPTKKRNKIKIIYGHIPFGLHKYIQIPVSYFTLLRDPIERTISHYYHIRKRPNHFYHRMALDMDIGEFIVKSRFREFDNGQVRQLTGAGHLPFGACSEELLAQAIANLENHFCAVGLQERFDESVVLLRRTLGWKKPPLYRRRNVNRLRPRGETLPTEALAVITAYNELDRQLYAWAATRLEQAIAEGGVGFALELRAFRSLNRLASALVGLRPHRPRPSA
ncbi:MAG: sulfotransferase family 2 domain-containing protein [Caldilineales bacterium]|nr:sulfotransferase family 2 domain-containing protein [Caldilineales bacterium]